jgi:predicted dehydrogenase
MSRHRWYTALIGFGKIGAGYESDSRQAAHFRYSTHVQVLAEHPDFDLQVVIDTSESARIQAVNHWKVPNTAPTLNNFVDACKIEFAVIATPPDSRLSLIDGMPALRGVLIEKPLGQDISQARHFLDMCARRGIQVAVNVPRRFDQKMKMFSGGELAKRWGRPQAVFGVYGNGLRNNGTHLVDLVRMLFGEVLTPEIPCGAHRFIEGPINGDTNIPFTLSMERGLVVMIQPILFQHYREIGLDIWGEKGRLQLLNETLLCHASPRKENRQLSNTSEIAHDQQESDTMGLSIALYAIYDNIARVLAGDADLTYSGEEAYKTMAVVEKVCELAEKFSSTGKINE